MKLIFYCFGGTHSSVATAAIHLGMLSCDRVPKASEILSIGRFDRADPSDEGIPYFMGTDSAGRGVYVLGVKQSKDVGISTLADMCMLLGCPRDELYFVATLPTVGLLTRIGGYPSRGVGWVTVGRYLVTEGIRRDHRKLVDLARSLRSLPIGNP